MAGVACVRRRVLHHQSEADKIHVSHGVLEPRGDEGGYRQHGKYRAVGWEPAGER